MLILRSPNNPNDFIVDFDEVWNAIGFARKDHAKTLLESKNVDKENLFDINIDYIIKMNKPTTPAIAGVKKSNSSPKKEIILLTVKCFNKFCLKASTKKAEKIFDYYIKMEEIIIKYIENKHNEIIINNNKILEETKNILQLKDQEMENKDKLLELRNMENNQLLELKDQEIKNKDKLLNDTLTNLQIKNIEINNLKNKTYEEINKDKHIYIFSTDKPNIFKCGRATDITKRKAGLQTGNVDNIITLEDYCTSNEILLEKIVHNVLGKYRCSSGREHFFCNWKYIQLIIRVAGCFLDTLKSTFENITEDELLEKINNKFSDMTLKNSSSKNKQPKPTINNNNKKTIINNIAPSNLIVNNKIIKCEKCNAIFSSRQAKYLHKKKSCKSKLL